MKQVNQTTKIQLHQLEAIESGNLDRLPPAVYVRSFIKIYADFLGCQGKDLALTFPIDEAAIVTELVKNLV
ncbi:helix-turn-helix domain-containing protein [Cyanobacteria bacterium FACHB-63]|nr:helix-turn-helix domain-containing protein [Cyanobacteria bacterium FACHB-63]